MNPAVHPPGHGRAPEPFDIRDPLPTGTTLLEASAGTGKTWTIGALVTRFVAEGVATLEEMLVVTFGKAASQELRERVRAQLVEAEHALADPATAPSDNEVVTLLLACDPAEQALRRQRLRAALASFDGATIATIHQFCHQVLRSLGVAGDTDASARLVEDLDDLLVEVVDDIYLRGFARSERPEFSHAEALKIAREAAGSNPQARLEPADPEPGSVAARRVGFARAVRQELAARKRRLGVLSYDDLLSQLADALQREDAPARDRMRRRWKVVLVDEFQDTDPVQWQVFDRAFSGHATMVLIGDPKQAIYAFRGGDVVTYLEAARTAATAKTLGTNWRSDAALLERLQVVLHGAALGDPGIVVHDVRAAHPGSRLSGAPHPDPFRLRVARRDQFGNLKRGALPTVGPVRQHIARDVARDITGLLASGAEFDGRPLQPRDIAVLAHAGDRLTEVKEELRKLGVPAVVSGGGTVFQTPGATEWLTLLEGLEQPHRSARVRAAALTSFIGHSAEDLDQQGDALTDAVARRLRDWAELFDRRGVAAVMEAATIDGLPARVLRTADGERRLTDLRHTAQALHEAAVADHLGLVALLTWLRQQMAEDRPAGTNSRTRRLDSDAAAVQLVTIHGSKGLQYPIVYLPYLSERWLPPTIDIPMFHGSGPDRLRSIDVGGEGHPDFEGNTVRHREEEAGESLRLLYVALTRAQSQVVAWWAPNSNIRASALQRILLGRPAGVAEVPDVTQAPSDDDAAAAFAAWSAAGGPVIEPSVVAEPVEADLREETDRLGVRDFSRTVDTDWRRTSYSALSRALEQVDQRADAVGSEPEEPPREDEPPAELPVTDLPDPDALIPDPRLTVPSPMADLPVGATFGSLVHGVLEDADPAAPDFREELLDRIGDQLVRWPVPLDPAELADALEQVCDSPLGPLAGDATLRRIPLADRLPEMEFELPLAGGDVADYDAGTVQLGDVAVLLRRHLPEGDPLIPYAELLETQPLLADQVLRGYLTGSVDVVLRLGERYLVVDYKTNWLGTADTELTAYDYRPEALAAAMGHSDYPLQALLYAVVLHRFLRWRQPGYDPDRHLGGVLYLYLRGMCGPQTPVVDGHPTGVFSWRPPTALVLALSDLLDGAPEEDVR
ncbi:UvrD-helicase domain-containing protein [Ornithinicoccus hortensis]|uniref:RecBCD enzyme subunit RecB n=1 Tax=Ornithinicoccus hortensis TaxID=82346 RepID=A0A542YM14_9MICO|nr:UvrD-helicase domain-containing protein [Ornithinicoccus hortensis]TQL49091.1 DNA helicase/exodeoxyribonuclease V beta subunit [Ornithinicoccus hortensis]